MIVRRDKVLDIRFPYVVRKVSVDGRDRLLITSELPAHCPAIALDDFDDAQTVWPMEGGAISLDWIEGANGFVTIQAFYKGFQGLGARIVQVMYADGAWTETTIARLSNAHRLCVVEAGGVHYVLVTTLCGPKHGREDWSSPGAVYAGRIDPRSPAPLILHKLLGDIWKNHGVWEGSFKGQQAVFVSGEQGLFAFYPPASVGDEWTFDHLLNHEISETVVFDLDGDGEDEIVTIEGFHGNNVVVRKRAAEGVWREVYRYPVDFGHVLLPVDLWGQPGLLVGYRGGNGALLLLRCVGEREGNLLMDITVLDEHEGPTNAETVDVGDEKWIFASSGNRDRVMRYRLACRPGGDA